MNSFDKIFCVLETVLLESGTPVTPSMAARLTGLNIATCTRLMAALAEKGYLEQKSSRLGYIAGPMSVALTLRPNFYSLLANAAQGPIEELSQVVQAAVNLAVICNKERVMIVTKHRPTYGYWKSFRFPCEYNGGAATDRLLSACRKDFICPDRETILKTGRVEFVEESSGLVIMGNLVRALGYPPAALGFGFDIRIADLEMVRQLSTQTAQKIERALTPEKNIF